MPVNHNLETDIVVEWIHLEELTLPVLLLRRDTGLTSEGMMMTGTIGVRESCVEDPVVGFGFFGGGV